MEDYIIEVIEIVTLKRTGMIGRFATREKADGFIEKYGPRLLGEHILKVQPFAFVERLGVGM
jgi:hypothetical protein